MLLRVQMLLLLLLLLSVADKRAPIACCSGDKAKCRNEYLLFGLWVDLFETPEM